MRRQPHTGTNPEAPSHTPHAVLCVSCTSLCAGQAGKSLCNYKVQVQTSDVRGAGTDSDVTITVFGDKGDTGARALESSANVGSVVAGVAGLLPVLPRPMLLARLWVLSGCCLRAVPALLQPDVALRPG